MLLWGLLLTVFIAGGIGGLANAILNKEGFVLPGRERIDGFSIFRLGFLGNVFLGGVAAAISWGLYGPLAPYYIIGNRGNTPTQDIGVTLSTLVGALLIGIGGARWLTNELDKNMLRYTASTAAGRAPNVNLAKQVLRVPPAEALRLANDMSP